MPRLRAIAAEASIREGGAPPEPSSVLVRRGALRWRHDARGVRGPAVLVDIDGVLSDASGRQHFLNNPDGVRDWRGFFEAVIDDPALPGVDRLLDLLDPALTVVLLSGRPAWLLDLTVEWLWRHGLRWDLLVLRDDDDLSDAAGYKQEALGDLQAAGYDVQLAFDDDRRIVDMYRAAGVPCIYVHSGYYG